MSSNARKSRVRGANLRARAVNSVAAWDEGMMLDTNSVFVADAGVDFLDHLAWCEQVGLHVIEYNFLDGGVLVIFGRKRDADLFRRSLTD